VGRGGGGCGWWGGGGGGGSPALTRGYVDHPRRNFFEKNVPPAAKRQPHSAKAEKRTGTADGEKSPLPSRGAAPLEYRAPPRPRLREKSRLPARPERAGLGRPSADGEPQVKQPDDPKPHGGPERNVPRPGKACRRARCRPRRRHSARGEAVQARNRVANRHGAVRCDARVSGLRGNIPARVIVACDLDRQSGGRPGSTPPASRPTRGREFQSGMV